MAGPSCTDDVDVSVEVASSGSAPRNEHPGCFGPMSGFDVELLDQLDAVAVFQDGAAADVQTAWVVSNTQLQ